MRSSESSRSLALAFWPAATSSARLRAFAATTAAVPPSMPISGGVGVPNREELLSFPLSLSRRGSRSGPWEPDRCRPLGGDFAERGGCVDFDRPSLAPLSFLDPERTRFA
eukprot:CAMPEP_0116989850 /NCGR_PEP_ID=MMETSP0467-20121206/65071_1 /TAXON_ID=283647 /ORGANISM="Mesodinium pulex, Strain SPMC105" /LENGTH=109 /DNA_ID=CAMNT_0004686387 /DNA_START=77 /DNA_END=402 /DNA_ORIENTATION=+